MAIKFKKIILVMLFLLAPGFVYSETPAEQLTQLLFHMQTLQAHFTQDILDKKGRSLQTSTGMLSIQRPGKFRWETQEPSHQLLVADGKKIWFYDVDLDQVTLQKQTSNTTARTPAMLLSGSIMSLADDFNIALIKKSEAYESIFLLHPKEENTALFASVKLRFIHGELADMYLVDNMGQSSHLAFQKTKINLSLPVDLFQFSPPAEVDVITS